MTAHTAHTGLTLPPIGFGTYRVRGDAGADTIARAIGNGYTLIDSAFNYENEGAVGEGVRRSGRDRAELLVASKLPGRHHAYRRAVTTIEESVYRTGLGYLDLYLIHWPNPLSDRYVEAWSAMIEARQQGLLRHIGVCNFLPEHLQRLQAETGVLPEVNQIELHPYFPQTELLAHDAAHGIITQAWSPLGRGRLLADPTIGQIADRVGVSPAQVIIRWHLQLGNVVIPKSVTPERIASNFDVFGFELSSEQMDAVNSVDSGNRLGAAPEDADF